MAICKRKHIRLLNAWSLHLHLKSTFTIDIFHVRTFPLDFSIENFRRRIEMVIRKRKHIGLLND